MFTGCFYLTNASSDKKGYAMAFAIHLPPPGVLFRIVKKTPNKPREGGIVES